MGKGKNKTATKKADKTESPGSEAGITGTIKGFITEVEETSTSLASDMKQHFDDLTMRVSEVVSSAAETTVSMAEKVTVKDPADLLRGLLEEIKQASEVSVEVIKGRFDDLAKKAKEETDETPKSGSKTKKAAKKGTKKKKPSKKSKKKVATKKKPAAKKSPAKKAVSKKKVVRKKRAAVKKSPSKKPAARKKPTAKKAPAKKAASKKKSSPKKRVATRKKSAA